MRKHRKRRPSKVKRKIAKSSRKKWKGNGRWVIKILAILLFLVAFISVVYAYYGASKISSRFTGKIWDEVTRIYSDKVALFPGKPLELEYLRVYFKLSGYMQVKDCKSLTAGQWCILNANTLTFFHRGFREGGEKQSEIQAEITFRAGRIRSIVDKTHATARTLPLLYLEPVTLDELGPNRNHRRTVKSLEAFPLILKEGVLAMEDRKFYQHWGISPKGIFRAFLQNLRHGRIVAGGSTLTQQLVKNFFLSHERSFVRKYKEFIFSVMLELMHSKDEILEAYLNEIYLGAWGGKSIYGFQEAARFYFGKSVERLSAAEVANLVGLISSPGSYSPLKSLEKNQARRNLVIGVMEQQGILSQTEAVAARKAPVQIRKIEVLDLNIRFLSQLISMRLDNGDFQSHPKQVLTYIDPVLQRVAAKVSDDQIRTLQEDQVKQYGKTAQRLEVGIVAIEASTGKVRAYIGGKNFSENQFDHVVQAQRQVGSAIKPFVYLSIFETVDERGNYPFHPQVKIWDKPAEFLFSGQTWQPKNYNNRYYGEVSMRTALEKSLNLATVNALARAGNERVISVFSKLDFIKGASDFSPSMVLGAVETTPLKLVENYTAFPNLGVRVSAELVKSVYSDMGLTMEQKFPTRERIASQASSFQVLSMMNGVFQRGTARGLAKMGLSGSYFGKTGTSNDERDSWFIAGSRNLVWGVWVGNPENKPIHLTGASGAMQIWGSIIKHLETYGIKGMPIKPPKNLQMLQVDPERSCKLRRNTETSNYITEWLRKKQDIPLC